MKRIIALLLVCSIMLSLSGCYINTNPEDWAEAIGGVASEAAGDMIESAKQEASEAVGEAIDQAASEAGNVFQEAFDNMGIDVEDAGDFLEELEKEAERRNGFYRITYHTTGGINGPDEQVFREGKKTEITKEIPTREGYIFLGWTNDEESNEPQFFAGKKTDTAFNGDIDLYACWEECGHKDTDGQLYGLNLEEDEGVRCKQCNGAMPPDSYFFSDYLKATKPRRKWKYTKLKNDELNDALADYMQRKGYSYEIAFGDLELIDDGNAVKQTLDFTHEGIKKMDELIQLIYHDKSMYISLVKKGTWISYKADNLTFSVDTFRTIMTTAGTIHSIVSFGESCDKLSEEKLKGIANTYNIEIQKIESGMQFAGALGDITGFFYSLAGGHTISGLIPKPEQFEEAISELKYSDVSNQIFTSMALVDFDSNAEQEVFKQAFRATGEKDVKIAEERWPNGPTAAQTMKYIEQLGKNNPALDSWFFYLGWRVEYECACVIQMILDDQI